MARYFAGKRKNAVPTRLAETLLAATATLGRISYAKRLARRLLPGAIALAWLGVLTAMIIAAMLAGGFFAAYHLLLHDGVLPPTAILIVLAGFAAVILLLIIVMWLCVRHLRRQFPPTLHAVKIIDAFIDGLLTRT